MPLLDLNFAVSQPAFLGGYAYKGLDIKALSPTTSDLDDRAALTFALWRAALAVGVDAQAMMVTQNAKTSVCLAPGCLIIEAKNKLNLGLLRMMVRGVAVVATTKAEPVTPDGGVASALTKLASWIERIEAGRTIELLAGAKTFTLWAHKGQFHVRDGGDLPALRAAITAAVTDGAPIKGRYTDAPKGSSNTLVAPICLFGDQGKWAFDHHSVSSNFAENTTVETAAAVIALVERLDTWRMDQPADLTLFDQDGKVALRVVATQNNITTVDKI